MSKTAESTKTLTMSGSSMKKREMKPFISIIIPLYNKEAIIEHTINSILSQSFTDFELIIVNDGSTDGSTEVVEGIKDERITYIIQENGGPGKARNTGVNVSRGEWILFVDADDELTEGALDHLFGCTIKYPGTNIIDGSFIVRSDNNEKQVNYAEGNVITNNYKAFFYRETLPSTGHTLFKKELIQNYLYNTTIRRYEDVEMIMRILKDAKIVTTSRPIFYVNTAFSSASSARKSIKEDFLCHLDFSNKSFWEKMALYQFYLWERNHYPNEVDKLYPTLRWRYDMLLLNKTLHLLRKYHVL